MIPALATWTLTYWVHSTILIVVALGLGRVLARRPDLMSGVWKAALVGGFVTATVSSAGLGGMRIDVGRAPLVTTAPVEPVVDPGESAVDPGAPGLAFVADDAVRVAAIESPAPAGAQPEVPTWDGDPAPAPALAGAVATRPGSVPASSAAPAPATPGRTPGWMYAVAWLTLAGFAIGAASVAYSWGGLRRRLRPHTPITEGPLVAMLVRLRRRARMRRHVGLYAAPGAHVPMALGVTRPRIVLPPRAATDLPADEQRSMLAHELAHVFRRDPAWRLLALVVERGLFFQPLNRLASRRLAECAEYLADDWAARHTRQPIALASCLTQIAGWIGGRPRVVAASAIAGSGSQLRGRVMRLLDPPRAGRGAPLASIGIAVAMLGVIAIAPTVSSGKPHEPVVVGDARVHAGDDGTVVVDAGDGRQIVIVRDEAPPPARPPAARADRKRAERQAAKANRKARRELDKAMRRARKEGRAAPSREEVARILDDARAAAGQAEPPSRDRVVVIGGDDRRGSGRGHGRSRGRGKAKGHRKHGRTRGDGGEHRSSHGHDAAVTFEAFAGDDDTGRKRIYLRQRDGTTLQVEVVPGEPTRVRRVPSDDRRGRSEDRAAEIHARMRMEREIQREVQRRVHQQVEAAMREAARMQQQAEREVERIMREAERGQSHVQRGPGFAPPAPPAPPTPPRRSMKNPFDGPRAPSAPPARHRSMKNPFAAPPAPAPPAPPAKNPFAPARPPTPPTPPDVSLQ